MLGRGSAYRMRRSESHDRASLKTRMSRNERKTVRVPPWYEPEIYGVTMTI